jgi:hypothetical protein
MYRCTDPEALLVTESQASSDVASTSGQSRHKGLRSHVKSWLGNIGARAN